MSIDFISLSEYIFLKNKCSALTACSNYPLSASATRGKSHMTHVVFGVAGFFFLQSVFTIQSISNNFGLIILLNQSFRVSIVNFNSIEKSSTRTVHFSLQRTAEVASFSCLSVILLKNGACSDLK